MDKYSKSRSGSGFTLVEITVVMAIIAVLLVTAGLSVFYSQRNRLFLEQAAQDLAAEIRLTQSRILAIQKIDIDGSSFTPKAAVIRIETDKKPEIYYLKPAILLNGNPDPDCTKASLESNKTFNLEGRGKIFSITPQSPVFLIYTSPIGRFYVTSSEPIFTNSANNSCIPPPSSYSNENITVKLTNDTQNYWLEINGQTGEVTIRE